MRSQLQFEELPFQRPILHPIQPPCKHSLHCEDPSLSTSLSKTPQSKSAKSPLAKIAHLLPKFSEKKSPAAQTKSSLLLADKKLLKSIIGEARPQDSTQNTCRNLEIDVSPSTRRFQDEFMKFETKIISGRRASNSVSLPPKELLSDVHCTKKHSNLTLRFSKIDEISLLDLQNINLQLQQENSALKNQVKLYQHQLQHSETVTQKQKFAIQQLSSFNKQLKSSIEKLNQHLKEEKMSVESLQQICEQQGESLKKKESQILQYSKLENDIKQIEQFYLELLSNLSREINGQYLELVKLKQYMMEFTKVLRLVVNREEIPLDLLFLHKQCKANLEAHQRNDKDIVEAQKENHQIITAFLDQLKQMFEIVANKYVDEFSKIIFE